MAFDLAGSQSRYRFSTRFTDTRDPNRQTVFFGTRNRVEFVSDPDNEVHVVQEGDTLESLANRFYKGFKDPSTMSWVIAEFQPEPILDPSRKLTPGSLLVIPSASLVHDLISTPPDQEAVT